MNDFEKMCKQLNNNKKCRCNACVIDNEYVCAYVALKKYVSNDRKKLLKIKGEANTSDYWVFVSVMTTCFSLFVSILTLFFTIFSRIVVMPSVIVDTYGYILLFSIIIFMLYLIKVVRKYHGVSKWKGYIQIAIEEFEKEMNR